MTEPTTNKTMTEIKDGGPAFPRPCSGFSSPNGTEWYSPEEGMSLRDWFAGMAVQGILSGNPDADCTPYEYALDAYLYADAMLKARGIQ